MTRNSIIWQSAWQATAPLRNLKTLQEYTHEVDDDRSRPSVVIIIIIIIIIIVLIIVTPSFITFVTVIAFSTSSSKLFGGSLAFNEAGCCSRRPSVQCGAKRINNAAAVDSC